MLGIWGTVLCLLAGCFFWNDHIFEYFMAKAELTSFGAWW